MADALESQKPFEFRKLVELAYLVVILCAFSWAKEFLLPIVLAAMIGFLLTPLVSRLERWGLHPVLAVLGVVAIAFALIGGLCTPISVEALPEARNSPSHCLSPFLDLDLGPNWSAASDTRNRLFGSSRTLFSRFLSL